MAILQAERATRDLRTRLGFLTLDISRATEMCNDGQGFAISNCANDCFIRHLTATVANLKPHKCIVTCHTYEYAELIYEACLKRKLSAAMFDRNERVSRALLKAQVIVTVPERLYHLRASVGSGELKPRMVFLVDPDGITMKRAQWEGRDVCRASYIGDFRAACLAKKVAVVPVLWTVCPGNAFSQETLCKNLGVEAIVYLDGTTLRTASLIQDIAGEHENLVQSTHWLDSSMAAAREKSSRLMLVVGGSYAENEVHIREFSALRSYPECSFSDKSERGLRSMINAVDRTTSLTILRDQLSDHLRVINKNIVALTDVNLLYARVSEAVAIQVLSNNAPGSLLIVAARDNTEIHTVNALFQALRRLEPSLLLPHIVHIP